MHPHRHTHQIHSSSEHVSSLYAAELGLEWSLSAWYGKQQSAGFNADTLYIIEPIYSANPENHYFLKCDVLTQTCSFEPTQHLTSEEPCITQKNEFLYIVGGIDPSNSTTSQQINVCMHVFTDYIFVKFISAHSFLDLFDAE